MIEYPHLGIVLLTYKRTEEALATLCHLCENLGYAKDLRSFYIADDGSSGGHVKRLTSELEKRGEKILGSHSKRYSPNTGKGWNRGLGVAFQNSDFVMVMEDDWVLKQHFDIYPYIEMLSEREDVGMVRLSHLAVGNTVEIVGYKGIHYLKYLKEHQYAYSGNPHIRHARFVRTYGWYSEETLNPGELELDCDSRFRAMDGPDIWRPADIPGWGIFGHIGEVRYRE